MAWSLEVSDAVSCKVGSPPVITIYREGYWLASATISSSLISVKE
jgi:hypothetical protein